MSEKNLLVERVFHFVLKAATVRPFLFMHIADRLVFLHFVSTQKRSGKEFIEDAIHNSGLEYVKEFRFCPTRRFRADYHVPSLRLLVEYEGLVFRFNQGSGKSRHTSISGYTNDSEKYNIATLLNFKVLRYTAISYKRFADDLRELIKQNNE